MALKTSETVTNAPDLELPDAVTVIDHGRCRQMIVMQGRGGYVAGSDKTCGDMDG